MGKACVAVQLISTGGLYGAERALLELAGYLGDHGWASHVVALEGRGAAELVRRAAAQGLPAEAFASGGRLGLVPMVRHLRRLLGAHPRAIVHSHGYKPDLLLRWLNAPRRVACVATCHSAYSEIPQVRLLETVGRWGLRAFDRVAAVSPQIRSELLRSGVPESRIVLIGNGISMPATEQSARQGVRAELGLAENCRLIVQVGRLVHCKRNDLLISAMARLQRSSGVHLLLLGEGERRTALEEQVRSSALQDRVHFCGYRKDVARFLAAADALVVSSDQEGMPISILEAMAVGCPIVSTGVGAIPDVLTDRRDAWLVPPNDLAALRAAVDDVLSNPVAAQARSRNAHERYLKDYSRDAMGLKYLKIYREIWVRRGWASEA
jgi:glycosyltransferase involved in cell wall biosynthesis